MKKLLALLLALTLCLSLAACGGGSEPAPAPAAPAEPSSAAPAPEAGGNAGNAGAPADFSAVKSYTEIPALARADAIPVPDLMEKSYWEFDGAVRNDEAMTQEETDAFLEYYGYPPACFFDKENNAAITREPFSLYGPFTILDDGYTVLLSLGREDDGKTCNYVCMFSMLESGMVMAAVFEEEPDTVICFAELREDVG